MEAYKNFKVLIQHPTLGGIIIPASFKDSKLTMSIQESGFVSKEKSIDLSSIIKYDLEMMEDRINRFPEPDNEFAKSENAYYKNNIKNLSVAEIVFNGNYIQLRYALPNGDGCSGCIRSINDPMDFRWKEHKIIPYSKYAVSINGI